MTSDHWQKQYSIFFVMLILGSSLWVMLHSLKGSVAGMEENLIGKRFLIAAFNGIRYRLGDRVFPQVLIGQDGWMEFLSDGNLDDYQNALLLPEQMKRVHQKLDALHQELATRGITLFVVVAPNKATIYSEKVPEQIEKIDRRSRLDIFMETMVKSNSSYVIDLRPALLEERENHQLYYRTDTHWNALGAYMAYEEIIRAAAQVYPELQPYQLDRFRFKETDPQVLDLARLIGMDFVQEARNELRPTFTSNSSLLKMHPQSNISMSWANNGQQKTLLMYHDSFGVALQPFLQLHFKQAVYLQNNSDTNLSDMSWIDRLQPDIVIIEIAERGLPNLDILLSGN